MNENEYLKKLNIIYRYYGIKNNEELLDFLKKNKENKLLFLLILKNHNYINNCKVRELLAEYSKRSIENNIKKAEEKFLINIYFRRKYMELEKGIKKEMNYV